MKKTVGGQRDNTNAKHDSTKVVESNKRDYGTASVIAEEHGIGKTSVERAEKFAKGIDEAEDILPGAKQKVLSGSTKK